MQILTINSGSSSIKFAIYDCEKTSESCVAVGTINNIGLHDSEFAVNSAKAVVHKRYASLPDHNSAVKIILDWLQDNSFDKTITGVGHRVVHGGARYKTPVLVTGTVIAELRRLTPLAPNHLPHEILAIEAVLRFSPFQKIDQVACFDTAFHRDMPGEAETYPLPEHLRKDGIIRYGFHGLSYEYIMSRLAGETSSKGNLNRVIIAHLGHGASMAAIKDGRCMDTTMGFTPAGGLVMSTRTGDLDPGVIIYLLTQKGMTIEEVNTLVYKQSGLLGVSGTTSDMKELLEKSKEDQMARMAVTLFCYQIKKYIGAFSAALGGLDTLVFTGGIGENAPYVRAAACHDLEYLGIVIDPALNEKNAPVISKPGSRVAVRVIKTNEELMVARHTYNTLVEGLPLQE